MDSAANQDVAVAEQCEPLAEKRPAENGDSGTRPSKKPRIGNANGGGLKRVAEIVLVLSTMAKIRGGKKPTELEIELMAEARAKLVKLCEGLAPKDIVARDAIGAVIEDLGLNDKAKDQKLGFRGPRLTIAERFSQGKRKMEESRKYVAQSTPYTQPIQTSFNTAVETRGMSHTVRMIQSDKQSHPPISSGVTSASLPLGHVSTATPPSIQYQLPTNDVRPSVVSSGFPISSNLGRDSSSSILPRVERAQIKVEGGPNAPSYASQGQVSLSSNHQLVNAPTWSVQTQAATKSGAEQINPANQTSAKVEGNAQTNVSRVTPLASRDQNFRSFITQPAPGNLASMHQPLQPMNYVQPSVSNSHNEIAKMVQKLLQPKLPDHPTWIPPSRDYMNKALTCHICHLTINEVDNVLICDACEKGYHTRCAQSTNQRGIPRGEWHCARCLALSNGKPLPPKYGRVMRSNTSTKIPPSATGVQSPSEKKVGTLDSKDNQQKMTANGSSDLQSLAHTSGVALGSNNVDLEAESMGLDSKETQKNDFSSISRSVEEKPVLGICPNISMNSSEAASGSSPAGLSQSSSQLVKNSNQSTRQGEPEPPTSQGEPVKLKPLPHNHLSQTVGIKAEPSQPFHDSRVADQSGHPKSIEVASQECQEDLSMVKGPAPDTSHINESSVCTLKCDIKREEQDAPQANTVGSSATGSGVAQHSRDSIDDSHLVKWVGDEIEVDDRKNYYQSCCIDGVLYKLQDHVVFQSSSGKILPAKLQSMYEDSKTKLRWFRLSRYYFPCDLPENAGRPCTTDSNEVFETDCCVTVTAGYIQGPCKVLPPSKFKEESERLNSSGLEPNHGLCPVFLCKWLYDEFKGSFQPSHDSHVVDQSGQPKSVEVASQECQEDISMVKEADKSHLSESSECHLKYDIKRDEQDGAQANTVGSSATGSEVVERSGGFIDGTHPVEWVGDATEADDWKAFYQSCRIGGLIYKLQDHVVYRSSSGKLLPAKLQSMYEERKTKLKWFRLSRYYFPGDLPENVGRPCTTDCNEVFETDRRVIIMAQSVQGPCEVLPPSKYKEETERRNQSSLEPSSGLQPVFLCKWLYDEFKRSFQPISG
ncbi:uncharacterized protein LOC21395655 [Morus notabilis]|uniref:uncharacterized protein LOC21395655 n=1 Tax=Morus notabilis TaxID=981085 RepID=UPI000CED49C7|nr:uncharacterized protein LOC21395655 [Morus notabilis]